MAVLLAAEYRRLFRNKVFFALIGAGAVLGAFFPVSQYFEMKQSADGYVPDADTGFSAIVFFGGLIAAVLISLFTGTEYSDGTIRNKLICGHSRVSLYLSELTVNFSGTLIVSAAYYAMFFSVGLILHGNYQYTAGEILLAVVIGCVNFLAYASIITALAMNKSNKAGVAVFSIVMCLVLLVTASFFASRLAEPETYPSDIFITEDGVMSSGPEEPNPNYVSGTKREIYQFILDFLPSGQGLQVSGFLNEPEFRTVHLYYALILAFGVNLISIPVFTKKNIS